MKKAIIGKKVGMTQIFDESGKVIPVTVIEAGPCVVAQVKSNETDGYNAVQLGFGDVKESKVNKPVKGHFAKSKLALKRDMVNQEDLWDMALCITEDQVQWDLHQHQEEYSKERDFQDIWELIQLQYKT